MFWKRFPRLGAMLLALCAATTSSPAFAWGKEGHLYINRAAALALPASMPAFMRTPEAVATISYFGPEPDRWNSLGGLNDSLRPEHFVLLELADLAGTFPRTRLGYVDQLARARALHPDQAADLTPEHVGLQPYSALEVYGRLLAAMRAYRQLLAAGEDTRPVESGILLYAGWLGHYVGDGANPMHTSVNYNGWIQANPNEFTGVGHDVHGEWENVYLAANIKSDDFRSRIGPAHPLSNVFDDYVAYLHRSNALVIKTYEIEKAGGFRGAGSAEARDFTLDRLAVGASMLRDLIVTAWQESATAPPAKPAKAR